MFVPNFEAISHVTSVLRPKNQVKNLVQKPVLFKHGLNGAKNTSQGYYMSSDTFHSYQSTFGHDEFFFSFFLFPF